VGRCEAYGCRKRSVDLHHCFGRRQTIGEPLASHHTMTAGLCRDCHRLVHREPAGFVNRLLQGTALERGAVWWNVPDPSSAEVLEQALKTNGHWNDLLVDAGR
jgi:hypothetical protein